MVHQPETLFVADNQTDLFLRINYFATYFLRHVRNRPSAVGCAKRPSDHEIVRMINVDALHCSHCFVVSSQIETVTSVNILFH